MRPKYEQVQEQLLQKILSGELQPGDKLNNEIQLADEYGVSAITIRKALSLLMESGYIYRVRGSGSFVSNPWQKKTPAKGKKLIAMMLIQQSYAEMSLMRIISGIQRTLSQRDCNLLIDWNSPLPQISMEGIERMLRQQVDGFLIYPFDPARDREGYDQILNHGIPYVLLDRYDALKPSLYVGSNNFMGGAMAARTLIELGHERIMFLSHLFFLSSEQERHAGFCQAMREAGLPCGPEWLMTFPDYDVIARRVRAGEVTAIACCSDRLAEIAIRELLNRGLRIPEDVSVFGFDDNIYSPSNPIPLSTIQQNFELIGQRAAELLLWRLEQPGSVPPLSVLTDTQVILRDSTRKLG